MFGIAAAVTVILTILIFATMARRLLGVQFSRFRTVAAGFAGMVVGGPLMLLIVSPDVDEPGLRPLAQLALATACAVLFAMVFLVLAEAFVPSGSVSPIAQWIPALRRRIARTQRYTKLTSIAVRHGLGPYLRGRQQTGPDSSGGRHRLARSLRAALDEGGVTFVKLGQVLSTRQDLVSPEFIEELSALQDRAAPIPWEQASAVLTAELGRPLDEVFAEFEREPLATASIAQVYLARLVTGEEVVVKIQRPNIAAAVERDLDIVTRLGRTLEKSTQWGRSLGIAELTEGFATALREELDFRIEAGNMATVVANARARRDDSVVLPEPHAQLCGERVLVMNRISGVPLRRAGGLLEQRGIDPVDTARTLLSCVLRQIMFDGVFHADPHPGNVMVTEDGGIGLLDFGSVGRLDGATRDALAQLLVGLNSGNAGMVTDALLTVVLQPEPVDEQQLERSLGQFMVRHLGAGSTPSAQLFIDLFTIVSDHGLSVPPQIAAVFRSLGTLEGTLQVVAPTFDLVGEARAFGSAQFAEQGSMGSLRETVQNELISLLPMLRKLPRRVDRISDSLERGRLSVNVRLLADERDRRFLTGLVHQVLLTVLGVTGGLLGVLLLGLPEGPDVVEDLPLYDVLGYAMFVLSSVLVLRVVASIFRNGSGDEDGRD
ncbi:ABC1 kinase family protein [Actinoalloteichus hymeniacidonis]|uniref:Unusual protein kinase n=1 Tax=Actinoalloteichus hymeniacidonis TaxID=340345 RepID=A0AAC9HRL2_9PSEU|nr:AarF/UbiB family protein [Actinoalloteichus hymeniacidonis]AOS63215.1 putative unusual protein kinase [Actinoalloteichus hymeniacidonis]MBB5908746.1 ubiquinone biosynthesis protein [Actinoalloteichus hymeniacidonis]